METKSRLWLNPTVSVFGWLIFGKLVVTHSKIRNRIDVFLWKASVLFGLTLLAAFIGYFCWFDMVVFIWKKSGAVNVNWLCGDVWKIDTNYRWLWWTNKASEVIGWKRILGWSDCVRRSHGKRCEWTVWLLHHVRGWYGSVMYWKAIVESGSWWEDPFGFGRTTSSRVVLTDHIL